LFGVYRLNAAATAYENVIEVDDDQERQATEALVAFKTQVQSWKDVLLRGKSPEQLDKYWGGFEKSERAAQSLFAQARLAVAKANESRRFAVVASLGTLLAATLSGVAGAIVFSRAITRTLGAQR
jgi:methyl-accepting chemotaxis protein-1 (serine sensor receptor)